MRYVYIPIYARNVLFSPQSENIFKRLLKLAKNESVKNYVTNNLRTYIVNYYPTTDLHLKYTNDDPIWVRKAVSRNEVIYNISLTKEDWQKYKDYVRYLNTVTPEKVDQISVRDLDKKVKDYYKSIKEQSLIDTPENAKTLHKYKDGYRWVQLTSPASIRYETKLMNSSNNILEDSAKYKPLNINLISLRDSNNKSCVDIEITLDNNRITRIISNNDNSVDEEYLPFVLDFLNKKYIPITSVASDAFLKNGFFFSKGKAVCFNDFDGQFNGNIELQSCDNIKLPDNITVNGDLNISDSKISSLPEGLVIKGNLKISNSRLKTIPEDITVSLLELSDSNIRHLPQSLPNVKKIVIGKNVKLLTLPENFNLPNGSLEIQKGNRITELPLTMNIGKNLVISSDRITNLPRNLTVGKYLLLDGSRIVISRLSDELKSKLK